MMLHTVSAEPCSYFRKKTKNMSTNFHPFHLFLLPHRPAPTQPVKPRVRRRLRDKSAVQRPAGRLFFRRCQRRAAERHAGSTPRVGSSTADRALRSCGKHPGSYAPHKARSSPPHNSSTHILLSNPIARPLPLLYPRTFVLLPRAAQESGASRHSETLSWFGGLGKVKSSRSSASSLERHLRRLFLFLFYGNCCVIIGLRWFKVSLEVGDYKGSILYIIFQL